MNRNKGYRIISVLLFCAFLLLPAFSVTAGTQKVDPKKGYPYNDDKNFRYKVEAHPNIPSGWNGDDYVIANQITVWDANQTIPKIISIDDYVITFKNLPKPEKPDASNDVTVYLLNEETKPKEFSTVSYGVSFSIQPNSATSDPEENWKLLRDYSAKIATQSTTPQAREGKFGKHRAEYSESDTGDTINNNNRRYIRNTFGNILVQLEDIEYPKAVLYLKIDWNVNCYYYLGSKWDNNTGFVTDEEKLPEAKALYEDAMVKKQEYVSRFENLSYYVQKTPHLTGESVNITIKTDAATQQGEKEFSVPAAVVLGALATAAAVGAAGAAGTSGAGSAAGATSGTSKDDSSGEEEAGSYQMIIGKDFGNTLKFGQKQRVWVRMVEIVNGVSMECPDMSSGISIFSREVIVGASSLQGNNLEVEVQIQEKVPSEGTISFLYNGVNGSFQNNVHFKLLGKGEIKLATDKVNILSTESKPFELVYELVNFVEEAPPLEITASSGFVALDMGKNDKQQTVILITPGPDAQPWDRKSFFKSCKCEITAMDGKLPIKALFEVNVCFEGIGTAYEGIDIDVIPTDALIECFTDKEEEKREEKALHIPLTVMKWDEKRRMLEPDITKSEVLSFTYNVHPDFDFKSPETKALAERVVTKARLDTRVMPAPSTLKMDNMKKPKAYMLLASADPDEGAAPFDIQIAVSCSDDNSLEELLLKAQIKPNPDFKGMVRWFLEYPIGSAAGEFITLGNVTTYHGALDFIGSRVYPLSGVPWEVNWLWNKGSTFYETGRKDIMRDSYIAIQDDSFPKGIGDSEFKKVQALVHELCHVIEDQHGDYRVDAIAERHAYYLQHLSDLAGALADMEDPNCTLDAVIQRAVNGAYWHYMDPEIMGDLSNIGPWFGAAFKLSVHELFNKYAYHIDTLGGKMNGTHRETVAKAFRHWYFPGNLSEVEVQRGVRTDAIGRFVETDGLFKDAQWTFSWNQGMLRGISLTHSEYTFDIKDYEWMGGRELKLRIQLNVKGMQLPEGSFEPISVVMDGGTYNMSAKSFPFVRSFAANWNLLNDHHKSPIYQKTGFNKFNSWTERKKQ